MVSAPLLGGCSHSYEVNPTTIDDAWRHTLPYAQVNLRQSPHMYGSRLRAFDLQLVRDRPSRFVGWRPDGGWGTYQATVHPLEYARLCRLIDTLDVSDAEAAYDSGGFHQNEYSLRLFDRHGRDLIDIQIRGEADCPSAAWGAILALRGLIERVEWSQVGSHPGTERDASEEEV